MDDLISRQAAIDLADDLRGYISVEGYWVWIERLKNLPSAQQKIKCIDNITMTDEQVKEAFEKIKVDILAAQPERNTGKWERHYTRPNVYADLYWHCSQCGYKNDSRYADRDHNFCPHCGCKMER